MCYKSEIVTTIVMMRSLLKGLHLKSRLIPDPRSGNLTTSLVELDEISTVLWINYDPIIWGNDVSDKFFMKI